MIDRTMMGPLTLALGVTVIGVVGVEVIGTLPGHPPILEALSWLVAMIALPGTVTYVVTRRDFGGRGAALATVGCVILMGVGAWLGFVFSFFAFFVAAAVYLVLRRRVRVGSALAISTVTFIGGLVVSVLAMARALDGMG
ncbi:hypothetical protein K7711_37545 [Nocardia sp. CA2R105]|uniref:hypothetical protein n=1 Tax=Nocardia coffeae TaxID=2873381 RepID=UPI001CA71ECB|nr:hypothetical protein [Nocardia coffeae]MBY8862229.1 hypothetical protein [Nocardia coffeae]